MGCNLSEDVSAIGWMNLPEKVRRRKQVFFFCVLLSGLQSKDATKILGVLSTAINLSKIIPHRSAELLGF